MKLQSLKPKLSSKIDQPTPYQHPLGNKILKQSLSAIDTVSHQIEQRYLSSLESLSLITSPTSQSRQSQKTQKTDYFSCSPKHLKNKRRAFTSDGISEPKIQNESLKDRLKAKIESKAVFELAGFEGFGCTNTTSNTSPLSPIEKEKSQDIMQERQQWRMNEKLKVKEWGVESDLAKQEWRMNESKQENEWMEYGGFDQDTGHVHFDHYTHSSVNPDANTSEEFFEVDDLARHFLY